jgi:hypothetical protein
LICCSCGPVEQPQPVDARAQVTRDAIIGGTTDPGDPEVFELMIVDRNNPNNGGGCSGTLIAPTTILTAAHCVDPRTIMATAIDIYVLNATNDQTVDFPQMIHVTKMQYHPMWDPNALGLGNDIGLALLERSPTGVTPKVMNRHPIDSLTGKPIRVVGYGASLGGANPSGAGIKRQVPLMFDQIRYDLFELGDGTGHGICHGDSGGPSFYMFPDGVERIVGVHSFTNDEACLTGADSRTDYFKSFIDGWLMQNEAPSCAEDGRCAANCPQVDIDCACAADGQCTAQCPDLSLDPDCPKDCGKNGVCSQDPCPVPDVDCVPEGDECTYAVQCVTRVCISDAQHTQPYCSKNCASDADCMTTPNMRCDLSSHFCAYKEVPPTELGSPCTPGPSVCAASGVCAGDSETSAYCSTRCMSQTDCTDAMAVCTMSFDGVTQYCKEPPRPVVTLPEVSMTAGDAVRGCSAAGGLLPLLGMTTLFRRRRRR